MIEIVEKIKKLLHIKSKAEEEEEKIEIDPKFFRNADALFDELGVDELSIYCGEDFWEFADELCDKIWDLRIRIKKQTGFIMPSVRILDKSDLQENEIRINVRNNTVYTDFLIPTEENFCDEIVKNLEIICFEYLEDIFSNELVEKYIDHVNEKNSGLIMYLNRIIPVPAFKKIFIDIIRNGKSINDITMIFEKIAEAAMTEKDMCFARDSEKISTAVIDKLNN